MNIATPTPPPLLDAVAFAPPERPAALAARFNELPPGGRLVLQLNQDPRPLLAMLQNEQPGCFEWSPLEEGPERWRIEIARRDAPADTRRRVSEALEWDHDRLDALAQESLRLRGAGDCAAALARWREFALGLNRHIGFEEMLLFPRFEEKARMPPGQGPTAVMRDEHRRIQALLAAITQRMGDAGLPVEGLWQELLAVLGEHNQKEEMILYPATEQFLTEAENDALVRDIQGFKG